MKNLDIRRHNMNKISNTIMDFLVFLGTLPPHEEAIYQSKFESWVKKELEDIKIKKDIKEYWEKFFEQVKEND